jgi:monoamine oxidase
MANTTLNVDVAIIGAGFSGLQAALSIVAAGLSCVLIEAYDRIGGKGHTVSLNSVDGVTEMEPTWINSNTQPKIYDLVEDYGRYTNEQYSEGAEIISTPAGVANMSSINGSSDVRASMKSVKLYLTSTRARRQTSSSRCRIFSPT